jgi:hypothetical protein
MQPTLEDQERHLLVKVIDRILYKLEDLVGGGRWTWIVAYDHLGPRLATMTMGVQSGVP